MLRQLFLEALAVAGADGARRMRLAFASRERGYGLLALRLGRAGGTLAP